MVTVSSVKFELVCKRCRVLLFHCIDIDLSIIEIIECRKSWVCERRRNAYASQLCIYMSVSDPKAHNHWRKKVMVISMFTTTFSRRFQSGPLLYRCIVRRTCSQFGPQIVKNHFSQNKVYVKKLRSFIFQGRSVPKGINALKISSQSSN